MWLKPFFSCYFSPDLSRSDAFGKSRGNSFTIFTNLTALGVRGMSEKHIISFSLVHTLFSKALSFSAMLFPPATEGDMR